ncbi:uncharacterized protein LOC110675930 isoform X2 [Aedes aegypti]|uniref:Uncharacterized protein n=1 Tax=Aedes aegypti TaxID=7159 RepID=A0A6I8U7R5_AEDAE|nr:uncharacterized protein LOC110675930 isoform X2 [Aedes aegypti]
METESLLLTDLPVEILEHILSYLPLSDRKAASLVCRFWNELAFSRRSLRHVALNLIMDWEQSQLEYLRKSSRQYRKVFAFFGPETCCEFDFELVVEVLNLFGADLESFHCMTNFTEEQLWNVLVRAPNLQHLVIGLDASTVKQQLSFPVLSHLEDLGSLINVLQVQSLQAPNLTQLSANFTTSSDAKGSLAFLQRVAPQLNSLELFSTEYFIPIDELRFPKLEVLKLAGQICAASDSAIRLFFSSFMCLKEVRLDFNVKDLVLDVLTTACPAIEKLHFKNDLMNSESFRFLERLKYLKTLSVTGSIDFRITLECKPLALRHLDRLEELTLKSIHTPVAFMLPNKCLKRLKIKYFHWLTDGDLLMLSEIYPNLQYLELSWCRKVTSRGVEEFRSRLKDCVVHCVQSRL